MLTKVVFQTILLVIVFVFFCRSDEYQDWQSDSPHQDRHRESHLQNQRQESHPQNQRQESHPQNQRQESHFQDRQQESHPQNQRRDNRPPDRQQESPSHESDKDLGLQMSCQKKFLESEFEVYKQLEISWNCSEGKHCPREKKCCLIDQYLKGLDAIHRFEGCDDKSLNTVKQVLKDELFDIKIECPGHPDCSLFKQLSEVMPTPPSHRSSAYSVLNFQFSYCVIEMFILSAFYLGV